MHKRVPSSVEDGRGAGRPSSRLQIKQRHLVFGESTEEKKARVDNEHCLGLPQQNWSRLGSGPAGAVSVVPAKDAVLQKAMPPPPWYPAAPPPLPKPETSPLNLKPA